jgi:hypothetical protein
MFITKHWKAFSLLFLKDSLEARRKKEIKREEIEREKKTTKLARYSHESTRLLL